MRPADSTRERTATRLDAHGGGASSLIAPLGPRRSRGVALARGGLLRQQPLELEGDAHRCNKLLPAAPGGPRDQRNLACDQTGQFAHTTTATAIRMASVANDIPASAPKPLGVCQVFMGSPRRIAFEASHAIYLDAVTEETLRLIFAVALVET